MYSCEARSTRFADKRQAAAVWRQNGRCANGALHAANICDRQHRQIGTDIRIDRQRHRGSGSRPCFPEPQEYDDYNGGESGGE